MTQRGMMTRHTAKIASMTDLPVAPIVAQLSPATIAALLTMVTITANRAIVRSLRIVSIATMRFVFPIVGQVRMAPFIATIATVTSSLAAMIAVVRFIGKTPTLPIMARIANRAILSILTMVTVGMRDTSIRNPTYTDIRSNRKFGVELETSSCEQVQSRVTRFSVAKKTARLAAWNLFLRYCGAMRDWCGPPVLPIGQQ